MAQPPTQPPAVLSGFEELQDVAPPAAPAPAPAGRPQPYCGASTRSLDAGAATAWCKTLSECTPPNWLLDRATASSWLSRQTQAAMNVLGSTVLVLQKHHANVPNEVLVQTVLACAQQGYKPGLELLLPVVFAQERVDETSKAMVKCWLPFKPDGSRYRSVTNRSTHAPIADRCLPVALCFLQPSIAMEVLRLSRWGLVNLLYIIYIFETTLQYNNVDERYKAQVMAFLGFGDAVASPLYKLVQTTASQRSVTANTEALVKGLRWLCFPADAAKVWMHPCDWSPSLRTAMAHYIRGTSAVAHGHALRALCTDRPYLKLDCDTVIENPKSLSIGASARAVMAAAVVWYVECWEPCHVPSGILIVGGESGIRNNKIINATCWMSGVSPNQRAYLAGLLTAGASTDRSVPILVFVCAMLPHLLSGGAIGTSAVDNAAKVLDRVLSLRGRVEDSDVADHEQTWRAIFATCGRFCFEDGKDVVLSPPSGGMGQTELLTRLLVHLKAHMPGTAEADYLRFSHAGVLALTPSTRAHTPVALPKLVLPDSVTPRMPASGGRERLSDLGASVIVLFRKLMIELIEPYLQCLASYRIDERVQLTLLAHSFLDMRYHANEVGAQTTLPLASNQRGLCISALLRQFPSLLLSNSIMANQFFREPPKFLDMVNAHERTAFCCDPFYKHLSGCFRGFLAWACALEPTVTRALLSARFWTEGDKVEAFVWLMTGMSHQQLVAIPGANRLGWGDTSVAAGENVKDSRLKDAGWKSLDATLEQSVLVGVYHGAVYLPGHLDTSGRRRRSNRERCAALFFMEDLEGMKQCAKVSKDAVPFAHTEELIALLRSLGPEVFCNARLFTERQTLRYGHHYLRGPLESHRLLTKSMVRNLDVFAHLAVAAPDVAAYAVEHGFVIESTAERMFRMLLRIVFTTPDRTEESHTPMSHRDGVRLYEPYARLGRGILHRFGKSVAPMGGWDASWLRNPSRSEALLAERALAMLHAVHGAQDAGARGDDLVLEARRDPAEWNTDPERLAQRIDVTGDAPAPAPAPAPALVDLTANEPSLAPAVDVPDAQTMDAALDMLADASAAVPAAPTPTPAPAPALAYSAVRVRLTGVTKRSSLVTPRIDLASALATAPAPAPAPAPGANKRQRPCGRKSRAHSRDAVPNGTVATDLQTRDFRGATFYVPALPLAPSTGATQRWLNERSAHALVLHIVQHSDVVTATRKRNSIKLLRQFLNPALVDGSWGLPAQQMIKQNTFLRMLRKQVGASVVAAHQARAARDAPREYGRRLPPLAQRRAAEEPSVEHAAIPRVARWLIDQRAPWISAIAGGSARAVMPVGDASRAIATRILEKYEREAGSVARPDPLSLLQSLSIVVGAARVQGAQRALEEGDDPPADAAALEKEWLAAGPNGEEPPMQANLLLLVESLLSYNMQRGARVCIERLRLSLAESPELGASVWGALVKPGATDREKRAEIIELVEAFGDGASYASGEGPRAWDADGSDADGTDDDDDSDGVEVEAEPDSEDEGGTDSPPEGELDLPTFSRLPSPAIELPLSPPEKRARTDAGGDVD